MAKEKFIPFGQANITLERGEEKINFHGKNTPEGDNEYLQVEGGKVTIEPEMEEIKFEDYGSSPYDHRVTGFKVSLSIVAGQETITIMKLAIAGTIDVKPSGEETATGVTDGPLGASNRERGMKATIHPRFVPASDKTKDFTIYNVASTGSYERPYGNEQGRIELEMECYPRDGADASKGGNFFYTGAVDPNGTGVGG